MPESRSPAATFVALLAVGVALAVGVLAPRTALAQESAESWRLDPRLTVGQRVRITLDGPASYRVDGWIDSILPASFVVDTASRGGFLFVSGGPELLPQYRQQRVRYDDVRRVEIGRGRSRGQGMLRWGLIGAGVGLALGALSGPDEINPTGRQYVRYGLGGALIGGAVGLGVGYVQGGERWQSVPLPERR